MTLQASNLTEGSHNWGGMRKEVLLEVVLFGLLFYVAFSPLIIMLFVVYIGSPS